MDDSNAPQRQTKTPAKEPLPADEKFYDPWEEEFRKVYRDDKAFDF
ncbi:hypothetical protein [Rhizobium leucaenae]|uniref:Uncharacterized protein n=1 Tax=Rhizobium leucaenae TaxID=29450 RepID=A0A7W6ZYQ2_9HYPH|nr:hypothetical protein [Rhizobium leucaenae]MBB4570598.1 hypothetical protein [Rhizobium leucaenae]